ncbi:hypothetical protein FRC03_004310 [Tulasnella sp. 419]|nr:hypothetical protein FRC03_004310 [Tulasnella sp. 419]
MHPGNALQEPPFQPYPAPRTHNGPQQGYHPPAGLPPSARPNVIDAQVRKPSKPSKLARIFKILME